jgi:hypothetical protein
MCIETEIPRSLFRWARPEEEMGCGCAKYIQPAGIPDWKDIDMVLVDGIARGPCLATLKLYLRKGVTVFLHDYDEERAVWYDWAVNMYDRVELSDKLLKLRV